METETMMTPYEITEKEAEVQKRAARDLAERVRIAFEEALEALSRIISAVDLSEFQSLEELQKELEKSGDESHARLRFIFSRRAQAIEQRYRAEIHRLERERFYKRIFKPP